MILIGGAVGICCKSGYIGAAPTGDVGLEKLLVIYKKKYKKFDIPFPDNIGLTCLASYEPVWFHCGHLLFILSVVLTLLWTLNETFVAS